MVGGMTRPETNRKLLLIDSRVGNLVTHRIPIIEAARRSGMQIHVTTLVDGDVAQLAGLGVVYHQCGSAIRKGGIHEINLVRRFRQLISELQPDICHFVSLRAALYGLLAAKTTGVKNTLSSITGLGYLFIDSGNFSRISRRLTGMLIKWASRKGCHELVFQNQDDYEVFRKNNWLNDKQGMVIRGSGVDLKLFKKCPVPTEPMVVLFPARYLTHKGIVEFVQAARLIKKSRPTVIFELAGGLDPNNPATIDPEFLRRAIGDGVVTDLGFQQDMVECMRRATIVCLPSYREGMPKVLLEAAATGRPLVATDVPGCKDIVRDGWNGRIAAPRDPISLCAAIESLLDMPSTLSIMGDESYPPERNAPSGTSATIRWPTTS